LCSEFWPCRVCTMRWWRLACRRDKAICTRRKEQSAKMPLRLGTRQHVPRCLFELCGLGIRLPVSFGDCDTVVADRHADCPRETYCSKNQVLYSRWLMTSWLSVRPRLPAGRAVLPFLTAGTFVGMQLTIVSVCPASQPNYLETASCSFFRLD